MKDKDILHKLTYGMYILTTFNAGCCVDAVVQISSGQNPLIGVSVMNDNYTNEAMKNQSLFALSILAKDVDFNIIRTFGYNSMRNLNKFEQVDVEYINDLPIISDSIGYIILEKIDTIQNDTHTFFIGKVVAKKQFNDKDALTYQEYKEKSEHNKDKQAWKCSVCGYIHYSDTLADDFKCPICNAKANMFIKKEENV